jgi:AcrR family transcriptional regulator
MSHHDTPADPAVPDPLAAILDAALAEFERVGIRRARVEDIARKAGIGRATLYRRFADKDALVAAALLRKFERFMAQLDEVMRAQATLEDSLVEGFVALRRFTWDDPLLTRLLAVEPETVLPFLTVEAGPVMAIARDYLVRTIRSAGRELPDGVDVDVAAEMAVRLMHSLIATPQGVIAQDDESSRDFARRYMVDQLFPRG